MIIAKVASTDKPEEAFLVILLLENENILAPAC
jgi:hypothetical protein